MIPLYVRILRTVCSHIFTRVSQDVAGADFIQSMLESREPILSGYWNYSDRTFQAHLTNVEKCRTRY